jgi:1-acyl-sn-glycerol-3-phosphate acyltransferase
MNKLRDLIIGPLKLLGFLLAVVVFLSIAFLGKLVIRNPLIRTRFFVTWAHLNCRFAVWYINLKVIPKSMPPNDQRFLFVSNHLGILDVLALNSLRPIMFVTSQEMRETPLLGALCEMGGCLFVERRNRANIYNEMLEMRRALNHGFSVCLYPEGTSTNGEVVLPFKRTLLMAAAGTGVPIMPMVNNYKMVNHEPINKVNRDYVFWYGDQSFVGVLWRILTMRKALLEVDFLDPVVVENEEQRREVAETLHTQISQRFIPVT